jgi:hypothetical protein
MKAALVLGYGDVNQLFYGDSPDLCPHPYSCARTRVRSVRVDENQTK